MNAEPSQARATQASQAPGSVTQHHSSLARREAAQQAISTLLRPESIVLFGVSTKRDTEGNTVLANLCRYGHADKVSVVHPTAERIGEFTTYTHAGDVPGPVDVAYVSLRASALFGVLAELEEADCRTAIVPTAGLTDEDRRRLREFTAAASMLVHGPNCMGLVNLSDRIPIWSSTGAHMDRPAGNVALVTQSGSASFLARATEEAGFSKIISTGDEMALRTSDYLRWLADDPGTSVVGAILESIADADDFADAVAALRMVGKPLIALRVGRSRAGAAAATAHTGALVSRDEAYSAFFRALDVPLAGDYDEMAVALGCLANPRLPRPASARLAVVTDSGGEAALMADLAEAENLELAAYSPETAAALAAINPGVPINNPLDAGASVEAEDDSYARSYQEVIADPNVDVMLVVLEAHGSLAAEHLTYGQPIISAIRDTAENTPGKPVLAVSSSSIDTSQAVRELLGPSVPLLRGMRNGLAAARALAGNQVPVPAPKQRPWAPPASLSELKAAVAPDSGPLDTRLTRRLLSAYGLPLVASIVAASPDEAQRWAEGRYPVVVKASSTAIPHRSDVGAVITGVNGPAELRSACQLIADRVAAKWPDVEIDGFEIQEQVNDSREAMLGFAADPVFGALVTVGSGGTLVELQNDAGLGLAPVGLDEASRMIGATTLGRLLRGYRNLMPVTDLLPLASACVRLSWLARDFENLLSECDLNPTFIQPGSGRVRIADALLVAG